MSRPSRNGQIFFVNGRVVNTCNLSEDWVGYSTRYGDSVGDFSPLSHFTVTEVKQRMIEFLKNYNSKTNVTIDDIIEFHYEFEKIHPFQDGNGRVGRLIMLKECLKHNIVPVIINEELKLFYYRGLKEYKYEKGYLVDTCLYGQDIVKKYLDYFRIVF